MKLSYREKIVLLVVIVLVVIMIFALWPIKLIRQNINEHQKTRETVQELYDENHRLINEIPIIEKNITKIYEESKDINKTFIAHKENFQIDEFFQEFLNKNDKFKGSEKNNFEILSSFSQSDAATGDLTFYTYVPSVIQYPILENADVNGDLLATTNPKLYKKVTDAMTMGTFTPQAVEQHTGSMSVRFTKEALFNFLDELKKNETGIRVDSVIIGDYKFNMDQADELANNPLTKDLVGYSEGAIKFTFYTMQEIQPVKFD